MGVDMKVKAIYDSEIGNITRTDKNWKDVLKVAGQLYRYEFDNIVMVTAQRSPERSTLMADYDTWKKVGRYVKRGAKGCAIFPSRALNPRMRYIFDISDTGGKNVKLTWNLEGENLKDSVACASPDTASPAGRTTGSLPPLLLPSSRTSSRISSESCILPARSPEDNSSPSFRTCPAS